MVKRQTDKLNEINFRNYEETLNRLNRNRKDSLRTKEETRIVRGLALHRL